jgi:hypothetical protein
MASKKKKGDASASFAVAPAADVPVDAAMQADVASFIQGLGLSSIGPGGAAGKSPAPKVTGGSSSSISKGPKASKSQPTAPGPKSQPVAPKVRKNGKSPQMLPAQGGLEGPVKMHSASTAVVVMPAPNVKRRMQLVPDLPAKSKAAAAKRVHTRFDHSDSDNEGEQADDDRYNPAVDEARLARAAAATDGVGRDTQPSSDMQQMLKKQHAGSEFQGRQRWFDIKAAGTEAIREDQQRCWTGNGTRADRLRGMCVDLTSSNDRSSCFVCRFAQSSCQRGSVASTQNGRTAHQFGEQNPCRFGRCWGWHRERQRRWSWGR